MRKLDREPTEAEIRALKPEAGRVVREIMGLRASGELEQIYHFMIGRIGEFALECDRQGMFWSGAERISVNRLFTLIRHDCRAAGFEPTNPTLKHLVTFAAKRIREHCLAGLGAADRAQIVVTQQEFEAMSDRHN